MSLIILVETSNLLENGKLFIHCSLIKLEAFNNSANYVALNPAFIIYGEEVRKSLLRKIFRKIIYRRWSFNNKFYREETSCCSWRIPSWNFKVLSHSQSLLGQLGCFKTEKSYERFWWPNLKTDVMDFISSCEVCLADRSRGKMSIRPWPPAPIELTSIDILVNLPIKRRGNYNNGY